ncbi:hypothetical protein AVEN_53490-1 [Araneus ventricosus]|uniref:Uncharacterized protein n=1 Tax=Araneus ventricosus TaxID=182803 RepID=A0A4Y2AAD1_ARAVE|nr:hypothetical protein AVEN_53490-1 [Araneus ventricosus]
MGKANSRSSICFKNRHESIGFTPSELVYGRNLRTPVTLLYEQWKDEGNNVVEYVFQLINRLKRCKELALDKMLEMQTKRKVWCDRKAIKREFSEGDLVLVVSTSKPNKLAVKWKGPGKIEKKLSETNYVLRIIIVLKFVWNLYFLCAFLCGFPRFQKENSEVGTMLCTFAYDDPLHKNRNSVIVEAGLSTGWLQKNDLIPRFHSWIIFFNKIYYEFTIKNLIR